MEHAVILLSLAVAFGLFMAWGIGANDVANAMGTSVGSKALTIGQAICVAAVFETMGAYLAGGQVTNTVRKKIINAQMLVHDPHLFVYGMLAALLAAAVWLCLASSRGWPVSTTHSIVGAVIGFGLTAKGMSIVYWPKVGSIFLSWIVTPLISGVLAYLLFQSVQWLIFHRDNPVKYVKRYLPFYVFLVAFVLAMVTFVKGLKHVGLQLSMGQSFMASIGLGILLALLSLFFVRRVKSDNTERYFAILMVFTAAAMAFAHGSNDVANAVGPLAAIFSVLHSGGVLMQKSTVPSWVLSIGALGILLGLATYGHRVIATVGTKITHLTPRHGFAAELATAATVIIASGFGLPISTTQTLIGGVLGVGIAGGIKALKLRTVGGIFLSWVITLPIGALLAAVFFELFRHIF